MEDKIDQKQVFIGQKPEPSKMKEVKESYQVKPKNGIWTSDHYEEKISAWFQWLYNYDRLEWYDNAKVWLLIPMNNNVFKIKNTDDIKYLKQNYPIKSNNRYSNYNRLDPRLNYKEISKDYHGVSMRMDKRLGLKIHWDVESTVWFNWRFTKVEKIGKLNDIIEEKFR